VYVAISVLSELVCESELLLIYALSTAFIVHGHETCLFAEKLKRNAEDKTSDAMRLLNEKYEFSGKKLQELQRQSDLRQAEIKDCLSKGQKEKAKLILKRKKMIEKQMLAVQNVCPRKAMSHHGGSCCRTFCVCPE
jgi:uncharacterized protein YydD (DUF2326 family)